MLNELEYPADAIDLQMAHLTQNVIRGTYNKAQLMPTRIKMMKEWADHIDKLTPHPEPPNRAEMNN